MTKRKTKPEAELPAPGPKTQASIAKAKERYEVLPMRPRVSVTRKGVVRQIAPTHSDAEGWQAHLGDALGSASADFCNFTLNQTMRTLDPKGEVGEQTYNAVLALFAGIAPQNELESAIAGQIVAANALSLDSMGRAARADMMPQREAYINQATKVSRTLTTLVEALAKVRSGGKQQVEVRYVYVDARTQTVVTGGGPDHGNLGQPHEPAGFARLPFAPSVPMPGQDPARDALPSPGDPIQAEVRPPRRQEPRRAKRTA